MKALDQLVSVDLGSGDGGGVQMATAAKWPTFTVEVPTGDCAVMTISDPTSDPGMEWMLRYGADLNDPKAGRFSAASLIESYDYLLSDAINATEAVRRLRLMRSKRAAIASSTPADGTKS